MSQPLKAIVHKTVAVLGASYGGARTAHLLAQQLPADWRVVLIDRNSHMNHLYVLPRFAVLPVHAHKAFVPYSNLFHEASTPDKDYSRHLILNAQVTSLGEHSLTLNCSFPEHGIVDGQLNFDFAVYALGSHLPAPINLWGPVGDEEAIKEPFKSEQVSVPQANAEDVPPSFPATSLDDPAPVVAASTVEKAIITAETDAAVLPSTLPQPAKEAEEKEALTSSPSEPVKDDKLVSQAPAVVPVAVNLPGTKPAAIDWLKRFSKRVEKVSSVLVVGGGALGIQYAADIAEVYPNKTVSLLHSRHRLLPRFDESMHDEILSTLSSLDVNLILGERLDFGFTGKTVINEQGVPERVVRTQSGREIRAELVMLCTGQTPNTDIMKSFLPDSIIPDGPSKHQIRVTRTLQVGIPLPASATPASSAASPKSVAVQEDDEEEEEDPQYTVPHPHIFAIGDAADAFGAINAGHTAYLQGEVAARNILKMVQFREEGKECPVEELERYKPGPPAIKVSLGLSKACYQYSGMVGKKTDVAEDLDAYAMWQAMHIETDEQGMLTL